MLLATARSVREERSKQRYALQDFSLIRVSLVRGKSGWRIGSVENEQNAFLHPYATRPVRASLLQIVKLVRQFIHGEEPHPELYTDVRNAMRALMGAGDPARIAEMFTLRLLHKLGYIAAEPVFETLLKDDEWLAVHEALPPEASRAVARALAASHL